ncbi:hypothetical protein DBV15_01001 [Temnothorax longispinosus]|uniref:Uncharacterized protein n=1 Tax=Temnothorax longispinosus TaxID=300112 RepID=A0A4S2JGE4_9HYME|nr:hypothetical protein DBV15_01001 [Temnothorax longispinosus]
MCTADAISAVREEGLSTIAAAVHQWIPNGPRNGRGCERERERERKIEVNSLRVNSRLSWASCGAGLGGRDGKRKRAGFTAPSAPRRSGPRRAKYHGKNNGHTAAFGIRTWGTLLVLLVPNSAASQPAPLPSALYRGSGGFSPVPCAYVFIPYPCICTGQAGNRSKPRTRDAATFHRLLCLRQACAAMYRKYRCLVARMADFLFLLALTKYDGTNKILQWARSADTTVEFVLSTLCIAWLVLKVRANHVRPLLSSLVC